MEEVSWSGQAEDLRWKELLMMNRRLIQDDGDLNKHKDFKKGLA